MEKKNFALILCGGQGTRFWPWSTPDKPKQFLNIVGNKSLIAQTYDRLAQFILPENIFLVADNKYWPLVRETIPQLAQSQFITEPIPRNTAPSLILSNIFLSRINPDANLLVVPADHFVSKTEIFSSQLTAALAYADNRCIITSGIRPSEPHTGYGYIKFLEDHKEKFRQTEFFPVESFREKPPVDVAVKYMQDGCYYWNSGMFIYKLRHFREFLAQYAPYYFEQYQDLEKAWDDQPRFIELFKKIKPQSIDYALMEKVKDVRMFPAEFVWSDVGSWSSVYELGTKDFAKNVCQNNQQVFIDSTQSLIFSTETKPIAILGLNQVAVINTENGILISTFANLQNVKLVFERLAQNNK